MQRGCKLLKGKEKVAKQEFAEGAEKELEKKKSLRGKECASD